MCRAPPTAVVPLSEMVDLVMGAVLPTDELAGTLAEADDDLYVEGTNDGLVEGPAERGQSVELLSNVRLSTRTGEHQANLAGTSVAWRDTL